MSAAIKGLVSKNKKRYKKDGFDLDLTYICDNVIAMGFPSEKIEGFYRNNIEDVTKFLEKKHPGRYRIYNLCSERSYDPEKFKGSVVKFPFKDHNPPTLSEIPRFCSDVQDWLTQHEENVAVVHCKAGKGRTGLMICCYLLHCGKATSAAESLSFYAQMRTKDKKGVTIPSQQRYVQYYEHILKSPRMQYTKRPVLLREIILEGCLGTAGSSTIWVDFTVGDATFTSGSAGLEWKKSGGPFSLVLDEPLALQEDIKVDLYVKHMMRKERLCHFWFNTFFIDKSVESKKGEGSSLSSCNRTIIRFSLQDPKAIRSSTDSVRDLDRTMSCPAPADTNRPSLPEEWTRWDSMRKLPPIPVTNLMNCSSLYLSLPKSHLDKANKKVFGNKSNFKITLGFSPDESMLASPRCFRSNSDSAQQTPLQRYSSTSSSSSSTDDELSSESSADSSGALVEGKHYKS